MVLSISSFSESVGSMKQWLPSSTGVGGATIPQSWLICDGSTVADASSSYNGVALPDTRAKFKRGHNSLTNSNFASDNTYKAGGTIPSGGADTNNLLHSHAYGFNINHQHGLTTSASYASGGNSAVSTSPTGLMLSNDQQNGSTNNGLSATQENRPAFQEFVTIIKIK